MKNYIQYLTIGALLMGSLTSCNDFLDREPLDKVTPEKFFSAEADLAAYAINNYKFVTVDEGGNLAASKIRNLECPSYEICLIDYGCGKFNRKIHIMEQYP